MPMAERRAEPGYVPVSYEEPTEYEPYPGAPVDLPPQVEYEAAPTQAVATAHRTDVPLAQAILEQVRKIGHLGGREARTTFWLGAAGLVGTLAVLAIVVMTLIMTAGFALGTSAAGMVAAVGTGGLLVAGLGALATLVSGGVRRLHDTGLPGWLMLLWFVPFGWIAVLVLLTRPGQPRPNGFGPPEVR